VGIFRNYPLKTRTSKQPNGEIPRYKIIHSHPLKYPRSKQDLKVFRVDVEHNLLEEVRSLGSSRALFLGDERCLSVDADKLPSIDGDCVYMSQMSERRGRVYNLRDDGNYLL
jgi:hypothetical protein